MAAPRIDTESRAVIAALVTVLLWASAFVGIRSAGRVLEPGALALGRLCVGSLALGALVLARRESMPRGRPLAGTIACGIVWFALYNLTLNAAERRIDAGIAALLVNVGPILIAVVAGIVLREGFPPRLLTGCAVSFAGAALIAVAVSRHGLTATWGAVLCLLAAVTYAAGVVIQKPVLRTTSALVVTWLSCTVGAIALLPYAPLLVRELRHASAGSIAWTVYLGVAPTAVGFVLWAYALARTTAGRMGQTTYLVPPLAVVLGWLLLGEVPPLLAIPGGLLCLGGVALSRAPARRRSRSVGDERALNGLLDLDRGLESAEVEPAAAQAAREGA